MTRLNTVMPRTLEALWLAREIRWKRGLIWAMGTVLAVGLVYASYV